MGRLPASHQEHRGSPTTRHRPEQRLKEFTARLRAALGSGGDGQVDDSVRRRAEYSTDASNYRVVPQAVLYPRHTGDVEAAHQVCRELAVPLTSRGGGTSVAGNAIGPGLVVDFSRHLDRILSIDPDAQTATVEPGVVLDDLQKAVAPHALRERVFTLAQFLARYRPEWQPPIAGTTQRAVVQEHCHQHAAMGFGADRAVLAGAGVDATVLSGCCGLAGNFGAEKGHYDVSVTIAEHALLPAVRRAMADHADPLLVADGFSCRTQTENLTGRRPLHLAEVLAQAWSIQIPS